MKILKILGKKINWLFTNKVLSRATNKRIPKVNLVKNLSLFLHQCTGTAEVKGKVSIKGIELHLLVNS